MLMNEPIPIRNARLGTLRPLEKWFFLVELGSLKLGALPGFRGVVLG